VIETLLQPSYLLILLGSFIGSILGTTFGMGAGIVIAVIISVSPIADVVPLYALIILAILLPRFYLLRTQIVWSIVTPFIIGSVFGTAIAVNIYIELSENLIAITLGVSILTTIWLPPFWLNLRIRQPYVYIGVLHSFIATLFGFGAIVNAAIVHSHLDKIRNTATLAGCGCLLNIIKPIAYISVGFDYRSYLTLGLAVFLVAIPGTIIGKRLGERVPEKKYYLVYKIIVTMVVFHLFYRTWQNIV